MVNSNPYGDFCRMVIFCLAIMLHFCDRVSMCLSVRMVVCLSVHLSICLSVCLLSGCLAFFVCPSVWVSIASVMSVVSVCLSVYRYSSVVRRFLYSHTGPLRIRILNNFFLTRNSTQDVLTRAPTEPFLQELVGVQTVEQLATMIQLANEDAATTTTHVDDDIGWSAELEAQLDADSSVATNLDDRFGSAQEPDSYTSDAAEPAAKRMHFSEPHVVVSTPAAACQPDEVWTTPASDANASEWGQCETSNENTTNNTWGSTWDDKRSVTWDGSGTWDDKHSGTWGDAGKNDAWGDNHTWGDKSDTWDGTWDGHTRHVGRLMEFAQAARRRRRGDHSE